MNGSTGALQLEPRPQFLGVLVADDEDAVCRVLSLGLRRHGFTVWSARDGHEALRVYEEHKPDIDLVLLDVKMPRLDGPGTLRALREAHGQVPCCFMTGHSGDYPPEDLLALGASYVFWKPFSLDEMAHELRRLCGQ